MDLSLCTVEELWTELQSRTVCAIFAAELPGNDPNGCEVAFYWKGASHNALGLAELFKARATQRYLAPDGDQEISGDGDE